MSYGGILSRKNGRKDEVGLLESVCSAQEMSYLRNGRSSLRGFYPSTETRPVASHWVLSQNNWVCSVYLPMYFSYRRVFLVILVRLLSVMFVSYCMQSNVFIAVFKKGFH